MPKNKKTNKDAWAVNQLAALFKHMDERDLDKQYQGFGVTSAFDMPSEEQRFAQGAKKEIKQEKKKPGK